VARVQIQGARAQVGMLSLGLSVRENGGWSPVRWIEEPVDGDGSVRLPGVKPGTYRLLLVYHPKDSAPPLVAGRWSGAEAEIVIAAGKTATAPPLCWIPDPGSR